MNEIMAFSTELLDIMIKPCKKCLVQSCCSEPCKDYAIYVYETKEYEQIGEVVKHQINNLPYQKAIDHILKVEGVYFSIRDEPL
jgi:hypothetical protein